MSSDASPRVLHLDLDAFFAAVEQHQKPSLRGTPVVVGGLGGRGVVATASYEARRFGVFSASSMRDARERCPQASFLAPRFDAYRQVSAQVLAILTRVSSQIEPLSLDEAYLDLTAPPLPPAEGEDSTTPPSDPVEIARWLRGEIRSRTGCTASVGIAASKLVAKIASDAAKPDGQLLVPPGEERVFLAPRSVRVIPGVGPTTQAALTRIGITTCAELAACTPDVLLAAALPPGLQALARGEDPRLVSGEREAKSIGAESTFAEDLTASPAQRDALRALSWKVGERLQRERLAARTITLKLRDAEFQTRTRSHTLDAPTDDPRRICECVHALLAELPLRPLRLLGVAASGFAQWSQPTLPYSSPLEPPAPPPPPTALERMLPGVEVIHPRYGQGWVVAVRGTEVRVRFEDETTPPASPAADRVFDTRFPVLRVRTR